jgi:pimeloyl-ACP methyl ester carboxylesterase
MSQTNLQIPPEYVVPLNMNGLKGRMLKLPPPQGKKREVLLIYGHHASLERFYSLAQVINDDAGVTMPDLPGFGGMDSFFTIGEKPDLDTMADYLASFIKLRYKKQRFTIAAISYGFTVATRMLERYPELTKRVDLLISVVGFAHHDDIIFSRTRYLYYRYLAELFSYRLPAAFFRNVVLHPGILRRFYSGTYNAKTKFESLSPEDYKLMIEFEIHLWRINETRTYMRTTISMLTLNNCRGSVDLPVYHIYVKDDNYFNNQLVEQHMRIIFTDFHAIVAPVKNHMPNVIAGKEEAALLVPKKIHKLIRALS